MSLLKSQNKIKKLNSNFLTEDFVLILIIININIIILNSSNNNNIIIIITIIIFTGIHGQNSFVPKQLGNILGVLPQPIIIESSGG